MVNTGALSDQYILVVEDEYYLSIETARALTEAGAQVLGPYPSETAARRAMEQHTPSAAVVDINLGSGPSFSLAAVLRSRGIPFIFATGYDDAVIPAEFQHVPRLQKPIGSKLIVDSLVVTLGLVV